MRARVHRYNLIERLESRWLLSATATYTAELAAVHQSLKSMSVNTMGPFPPVYIDVAAGATVLRSAGVQTSEVEAALDGDPWNDAVSATLPLTFTISLGRASALQSLQFVWDAPASYATAYTVDAMDFDQSSPLQTIAKVSKAAGQVQYLNVGWVQAAYLRITVTQATTGSAVVLRQFQVMGTRPTEIQSILLDSSNDAWFLAPSDPRNPLGIYGLPVTVAMQKIADKILVGRGTLTDHQKIVAFMEFLNDAWVGDASTAAPEETVLEGIGSCGNWSNTLAALAATQGLEARIIDLFNYPWIDSQGRNSAHVVTEIKIDGNWCVYDPTYGVYFTTDRDNTVNPQVLGFADLQAGMGDDPGVTRVLGNANRLAEGGDPAQSYASATIYTEANPSGVIVPDKPMVFSAGLALLTKPSLTKADFGSVQGVWILGAAYVNVSQAFSLTGLTAGQRYTFTAAYDGAGGDLGNNSEFDATSKLTGGIIESGAAYTYDFNSVHGAWSISFIAMASTVELQLTHAYLEPLYLVASSYSLKAGGGGGIV